MIRKLIYALLACSVIFSSCKKDDLPELKATQSETVESAKKVSTTGMCPNAISLAGNSPGGNKIKAVFDPLNSPAFIRVLTQGTATNDYNTTAGNSGQYISTNKYLSTELALQLVDANGNTICTCSYDNQGNLLPSFIPVQINHLGARQTGTISSNVELTFTSETEQNFVGFAIKRINGGTYDKSAFLPAQGSGHTYTYFDDEAWGIIAGFVYEIEAVYNDNSRVFV